MKETFNEYTGKYNKTYEDYEVRMLIKRSKKEGNTPASGDLAKILNKLGLSDDIYYRNLKVSIWNHLGLNSPIELPEKEKLKIRQKRIDNAAEITILKRIEGENLLKLLNVSPDTDKGYIDDLFVSKILSATNYNNNSKENNVSTEVSAKTPIASDINDADQPERVMQETYRILRDTQLARDVKVANEFCCQICGEQLVLKDGSPYAEAHHIKPLGGEHNGPDVRENILCVCPNHHALLDYGAIKLDPMLLKGIERKYIDYHNEKIFGEVIK